MSSRVKAPLFAILSGIILTLILLCWHPAVAAQNQPPEDEIVANLAGGRVIVHVARDGNIVFAAINQPVEAGGVPPRVVETDSTHVAVLLGASEWRMPADPNPVRLDRNFERLHARDPKYQYNVGEAEPDLETIGVAVLEKLRPLTSQLHHKIDLPPDDPLLEMVLIGYAPNNYGPEVWTIEYRVQQEQVSTRGEYWQTRILRPRFTQLYPPEKHAPRMIVEARYPADLKDPPLMALIQGNDPAIARLRSSDPRFAKVLEAVDKGQAQKAVPGDAADFLHLVAGSAYCAHFQARFADTKPLAQREAVNVEALRGDVFSDTSRSQIHPLQGLVIHQQHLALAAGPGVSASLEARIFHGANLSQFRHREAALGGAEQVQHAGHVLVSGGLP